MTWDPKPPHLDWESDPPPPTTQCKHGKGSCETCGTTDRRDVIHTARTPDKKTARRQRRKGK